MQRRPSRSPSRAPELGSVRHHTLTLAFTARSSQLQQIDLQYLNRAARDSPTERNLMVCGFNSTSVV